MRRHEALAIPGLNEQQQQFIDYTWYLANGVPFIRGHSAYQLEEGKQAITVHHHRNEEGSHLLSVITLPIHNNLHKPQNNPDEFNISQVGVIISNTQVPETRFFTRGTGDKKIKAQAVPTSSWRSNRLTVGHEFACIPSQATIDERPEPTFQEFVTTLYSLAHAYDNPDSRIAIVSFSPVRLNWSKRDIKKGKNTLPRSIAL